MFVRRIVFVFVTAITLSGCSGSMFGSASSGTVQSSTQCSSSAESLIPNQYIVQWQDGHFSVEQSQDAESLHAKYKVSHPGQVRRVEADQKLQTQGALVSAASNSMNLNTWGPDIIQASAGWNAGYTGQGILVGVVDAAVDYSQPQIAPRLAGNTAEINGKTGIDDDGNGYVDDYYGWDFYNNTNNPSSLVSSSNGHGTHVSGIIAADHSAGPVEGIAPGAQIIPANFMDSSGSGSLGTAILAMQYVAQRGAKVINASWGGSTCSQSLQSAMASLSSQGILLVVAAGNNSSNLDSSPDYPANFGLNNQLTIASTTESDLMDSWSNYSYHLVHLGAPGDTIFSTFPGATQAYMSGTSMATPMVTGAAALLWSVKPNATAAQIRQAILSGVDSTGIATITQGRLNISKAITALKALVP